MRVAVLVLNDVFDSGLAVVLDTLETANTLAQSKSRSSRTSASKGPAGAPFEVTVCGLSRKVRTHHGFGVPLVRAEPRARPDLVIVPALGKKTIPELEQALERTDVIDAGQLLAGWERSGSRIAGACTATFLLAASGILEGGTATTTWWLSPLFRERFPGVTLDESRMIVESRRVVTAGAALAHVDLALHLVRKQSPLLAHATARHLVFDARPSQATYVMPDHMAHNDELVRRFERWARAHLTSFTLSAAAQGVGASERTLERRIQTVLGRSPISYVQDLRVELAIHRLRTTRESVDEIAEAVGYGDAATLRALLRKRTGRGLRELRTPGL
jgi:transcriptional regulator GlxA family with amidase domain